MKLENMVDFVEQKIQEVLTNNNPEDAIQTSNALADYFEATGKYAKFLKSILELSIEDYFVNPNMLVYGYCISENKTVEEFIRICKDDIILSELGIKEIGL